MNTALCKALGIEHPIIQAPMAGGTTTPALVAAVCNAGALGSIGAGYLTPDALQQAIDEVRAQTDKPFAVNLFIPGSFARDDARVAASNHILDGFRRELGITTPEAMDSVDPDFDAQFAVVLDARPALFSSTFGALSAERVQQLKDADIQVAGTATSVAEARHLEATGVDMIVAQGFDAGGHRGTFLTDFDRSAVGTLSLVPQIVDAVSIPVIASGGIMDGRGIAASHMLGAAGVQMGSAFLVCDESGAKPAHKAALASSADTDSVITPAFSGKPARGLRNRFIEAFASADIDLPDYPEQNAWTKDVRAAAGADDRPEFMSLWSGQAGGMARPMSAAALVAQLVDETAQTIAR